MQREEDGDYEDREGENMCAEVEDPYITDKQYRCSKCGKKKMEKESTLFAPFCCSVPMKLLHRLEHKFDFETITRKSVEKEQKMFHTAKPVKQKTKGGKAKKMGKPAKKLIKKKTSTKSKGKKKKRK